MLSRRAFARTAVSGTAALLAANSIWRASASADAQEQPPAALDIPSRLFSPPFLLGFLHPSTNLLTTLAATEANVGRQADVVLTFATLDGALHPDIPALLDAGYEVVVCLEWWDNSRRISDTRFTLAEIARGAHDAAAARFWRAIAALPRPVHLRPLHEGNGDWYPWGAYNPLCRSVDYIPAYRRIVSQAWDIAGRDQIRTQWCMNRKNGRDRTTPIAALYPGDDMVDELVINGYNRPEYAATIAFETIYRPAYDQMKAISYTKPLWVGETASTEIRGDKAAWIDGLARTVRTSMVFDAITWFNRTVTPATGPVRDWPLDSSVTSLEAFRRLASVRRVG
ncbi:MAG: glycoside hydrolase family 26 protein [Acidimicrobiales bacterium]